MSEPAHIDGIDTSVPHSARVWNYWLGGKDHYEADRAAGDAYKDTFPLIVPMARESRDVLRRTVGWMTGQGIKQFLDVGAGLPTANNTHEIAQRVVPDARVVYVDHDPLVLSHVDTLLRSTPEGATDYLLADMRDTATVLRGAARTLDMSRPIGLVINDVLGHIEPWEDVLTLVRGLTAGLPSGSYAALSHADADDELHRSVQEEYNNSGAIPYVLRGPEQTIRLFDGLELTDPGFVPWPRWKPDAAMPGSLTVRAGWVGVARVP
ncbi:SAM-dependent methyltransferase [Streptomyces sp. NPDC087300]|uniref:SAM-dependent methyltransferase n=1 Tax=Streptomyces sp. NPDC087300 TaxID=3365780 RepID=UPI0037FEEF7E